MKCLYQLWLESYKPLKYVIPDVKQELNDCGVASRDEDFLKLGLLSLGGKEWAYACGVYLPDLGSGKEKEIIDILTSHDFAPYIVINNKKAEPIYNSGRPFYFYRYSIRQLNILKSDQYYMQQYVKNNNDPDEFYCPKYPEYIDYEHYSD